MKLLLDENISFRLKKQISAQFPDTIHISDIKKGAPTDQWIWNYAKDNLYCIVTQDEDFYDWQSVKGFPPKIIWIRTGNVSSLLMAKVILDNAAAIKEFENDDEIGILEIL